jgi:hypothetical protein
MAIPGPFLALVLERAFLTLVETRLLASAYSWLGLSTCVDQTPRHVRLLNAFDTTAGRAFPLCLAVPLSWLGAIETKAEPDRRFPLRLQAICLIFVASLAFPSATAAGDSPRDILILFNDMSQIPGNQAVLRGFQQALTAGELPGQQIFDEYLDAPLFPGQEHLATVAQYFKAKFASTKSKL